MVERRGAGKAGWCVEVCVFEGKEEREIIGVFSKVRGREILNVGRLRGKDYVV